MNRAKIQAMGGFLTAIVIPNMGAFLAWGFITALFIEAGWFPNAEWATIVDPMLKYLLPTMLAYTGGKRVAGDRGALIGAIGTFGLIVGADIPMFIGAMAYGPFCGLVIKKWDNFMVGKMPGGLEMIINNFSVGILGFMLCILSYEIVGPFIELINVGALALVNAFVATGFLPILAILCEPLKVIFLNNLLDQGIFFPIAFQDADTMGKSIFFMIASNPGPGFGLLLAYSFFGKGDTKETAKGASIVQLIGGIHEIYFPFVLMNGKMLIPMILGSMSSIFIFDMLSVGLVAAPSPGSLVAYMLMTAKGDHFGMLLGVAVSIAVSFFTASFILKTAKDTGEEGSIEEFAAKSKAMKQEGKDLLEGKATASSVSSDVTDSKTSILQALPKDRVPYIVFACDAGLGSSALGANAFNKKCKKAEIDIQCTNFAIEKMPDGVDIAVVHQNFAERMKNAKPNLKVITIENYMNDPNITELMEVLQSVKDGTSDTVTNVPTSEPTSTLPTDRPPYIVFACDAGLGSSALGANAFNKKCKKAEIDIQCTNFAIEKMPDGVDIAVVHKNFEERMKNAKPNLRIVTIENYMNDPNINALMEELKTLQNK